MKSKKVMRFEGWVATIVKDKPDNGVTPVTIYFEGKGSIRKEDVLRIFRNIPLHSFLLNVFVENSNFDLFHFPKSIRHMLASPYFHFENSFIKNVIIETTSKNQGIMGIESNITKLSCRAMIPGVLWNSSISKTKNFCITDYWNNCILDTAYDIASKRYYFLDQRSKRIGDAGYDLEPLVHFCENGEWQYFTGRILMKPNGWKDIEVLNVKSCIEELCKPSIFRAKLKSGQDKQFAQKCATTLSYPAFQKANSL